MGPTGPWHGIGPSSVTEEGGPGRKQFLYVAVLLCVCSTFASCVFFASGVILELQAVLCDGQLGAVVYIISSAATCKLLRTGEEMKARSGSLFWRNVMADGSLPHNANCRLRLNRPRERDLSSDLIVCALTWRAKSVNIK